MKTYTRKFPIARMRNVITGIKNANKRWHELDQIRAGLPTNSLELEKYIQNNGENGRQKLEEIRADLHGKEDLIRAELARILDEEMEGYKADLQKMFTITPDQLTGSNAPELQLLQLDLILTPEAMREFMQRNAENPALLQLAGRYADIKAGKAEGEEKAAWTAINAENSTQADLEGFMRWFQEIGKGAVHDPDGYAYMMATRPHAELDTMLNYNLLEEYGAATGAPVDPVSVFNALNGEEQAEDTGNAQTGAGSAENAE